VPRYVSSMGILNEYPQCGVTTRIYVVDPQHVDTMSILSVSTRQVDARRLVCVEDRLELVRNIPTVYFVVEIASMC
jgi:hypothetical protein